MKNVTRVLARKVAKPTMVPLTTDEMNKVSGGCFANETHSVTVSGSVNGGTVESQDCSGGGRGTVIVATLDS